MKRTFASDDVQTAFNADELGVAMHLFVRKNKDDEESKEFYYLGPIHSTGQENAKEIFMVNGICGGRVRICTRSTCTG
ncbi:MAG: DUF3427 domain-containing protein [Veillonella parvula]